MQILWAKQLTHVRRQLKSVKCPAMMQYGNPQYEGAFSDKLFNSQWYLVSWAQSVLKICHVYHVSFNFINQPVGVKEISTYNKNASRLPVNEWKQNQNHIGWPWLWLHQFMTQTIHISWKLIIFWYVQVARMQTQQVISNLWSQCVSSMVQIQNFW